MKPTTLDRSFAAVSARVAAVDLSRVRLKIQEKLGWSGELLEAAEQEYRQFLTLAAVHPGEPLTLSRAADEVWHRHILDTARYAEDCRRLMGGFLHHDPFGDSDVLAEASARTAELRRRWFAAGPAGEAAFCVVEGEAGTTANCVPCLGLTETRAGCVPCFGRTGPAEEVESAMAVGPR